MYLRHTQKNTNPACKITEKLTNSQTIKTNGAFTGNDNYHLEILESKQFLKYLSTFTTLGANSAGNKLVVFFLIFPRK